MVHAVKPQNEQILRVISGFCHDVNEICNLLKFYAEQSGNSVLTSQDNLPVPENRYGIITVCCIRSQNSADHFIHYTWTEHGTSKNGVIKG
jgi:hypothetical protein